MIFSAHARILEEVSTFKFMCVSVDLISGMVCLYMICVFVSCLINGCAYILQYIFGPFVSESKILPFVVPVMIM